WRCLCGSYPPARSLSSLSAIAADSMASALFAQGCLNLCHNLAHGLSSEPTRGRIYENDGFCRGSGDGGDVHPSAGELVKRNYRGADRSKQERTQSHGSESLSYS